MNGGVTVDLATGAATVLNGNAGGGFIDITEFTGDNANDTLIGPNGGATFDTSGTNDGTVAGASYTDFANITGGNGADIFNLNHDVTGSVNGGDDVDTFNLAAGVIIGGSIIGGDGGTDDDELVAVGGAGPNAWTVTSDDTGTLNGQAFSDIENLTGNGNVDNFDIDAVVSGTVAGLGGNDVFDFGGATGSAGFVDGGTGTDSLSYAARTAGVTVNMANVNAVESLTGSSFNDTFNFNGIEGNEITIIGGGGANDVVAVIGNTQMGGDLNVSDVDSVSIGADLDAGTNNVTLSVDGAITQSGTGGILTAQNLTVSSVGGQELVTAVSSYNATNAGAGTIILDNTGDLDVSGINNTGGGSTTVGTDGNLTQSGDITADGGDVDVSASNGSITMAAGTETNSNGADINYETTGSGGDITLSTLRTCADCEVGGSTGAVTVTALGDILAQQGQTTHITSVSASLVATGSLAATDDGNIGAANSVVIFRDMDPNGDAGDGNPILLTFGGLAFIDTEFGIGVGVGVEGEVGNISNELVGKSEIAASNQAASQKDKEDVDWAAFSEEITVYEINNNGVQLPQTEEIDEFAKLLDEALRDLAEEKETVTDVVSIFNSMPLPEGIPVSQLIEPR